MSNRQSLRRPSTVRPARARRRGLAVLAAVGLAGAVTMVGAGSASASASGCANSGSVYGHQFRNCINLNGSGLHVNYDQGSAQPLSSGMPVDFPNFVGCQTHVEFYNNLSGASHRDWNSQSVSCSQFASVGYSAVITINANEPAGQYCSRIWVSNGNAGYVAASAACETVHA